MKTPVWKSLLPFVAMAIFLATCAFAKDVSNSRVAVAPKAPPPGTATVSPSLLDFGTNLSPTGPPVYKASTLTNNGGSSITISSMQVTHNTGFSISSTTCGSTLGAGAHCSITVEFNPVYGGYGENVGSVDIYDSAGNSPQSIDLLAYIKCPPVGCP
jgi:hypothetical protein